MAKFFKKYRLLFVSAIFFALSWFVYFESHTEPNQKKTGRLMEQSIALKQRIVQQGIDSLFECAMSNSIASYVSDNYETFDNNFKNEGISFYVYSNEKLIYWTNNTIAVPDGVLWFKNKFVELGNSWVVTEAKNKGNITVVGVIAIKSNYSIENEYLVNELHPSFSIKDEVDILSLTSSKGAVVKSANGDDLFRVHSKNSTVGKQSYLIAFVLFFVGMVVLLFFIKNSIDNRLPEKIGIPILLAIIATIIVVIYYVQVPEYLSGLELFDPRHFNTSFENISLGHLLMIVFLLVFSVFIFYSHFKKKIQRGKAGGNYVVFVLLILLALAFGLYGFDIFYKLIHKSSFQFEAYNVLNLTVSSFIGYTILVLLYGGFLLLADISFFYIKKKAKVQGIAFVLNTIMLLVGVSTYFLIGRFNIMGIVFAMVLLNYLLYLRYKGSVNLGEIVLVVFLFSIFSTLYLRQQNFQKQKMEAENMAKNLVQEQDAVANTLIEELIPEVKADTIVKKLLVAEVFDYEELFKYTRTKYFSGYLNSYDFHLTVCDKYDSVLINESREDWFHCYDFFNWVLTQEGESTSVEGLYYLNDEMGAKNLFLRLPVYLGEEWNSVTLFIELFTKPNYEVLGYPSLLLNSPIIESEKRNVTYARYNANKLIASTGDFPYAFDLSIYNKADGEFEFFQSDGYDHLLYIPEGEVAIIISYPSISFYNILVSFTYVFIFFLILMFFMLWIVDSYIRIVDFQLTVKNRMVLSMIVILMLSLILMGIATAIYTARQFDDRQFGIMREKTQSVVVELEHKISGVTNIDDVDVDFLTKNLVDFSNVFYSDINIYDLEGGLVATSRKQIFDKSLISKKMNAVAFRELVLNKKAKMVQKERIGELDYYSSYVPFLSEDNKPIAYLNLPYFAKNEALSNEMFTVVVAVINVYAFLMVLSIFIAIYVSNRFTEPLRTLQTRLKEIKLGAENKHIEYNGADEVADLVIEYNRMIDELKRSAHLLAKSERESAWREMARQIAHEIKNPLTPMKLNMQLLERSLNNNDPDFEERFEKTSKNLIEQIDALSAIASSFSQFARIPLAKLEKVDLIERTKQAVELFKNNENVLIEIDKGGEKELFVKADNDRVLQVFNNLIKNAVQALQGNNNGKIHISFKENDGKIVVRIADNGPGINKLSQDKLFQPYFTTKTSGTGLGLAIVKTIVEDLDGGIWFDSEENIGTIFYVSFLCYDEDV